MKVRKLAVALALAGGLGSGVAQALGLGEIELQSYLNEPLNAEINLRRSGGISPSEVFVNIASESAFDRVGIDRSYFLTKLNLRVTTAPNGSLVVNVSSREPLREPYLNFLVEVTWPNGRLMREYSLLVDPPVYAEESGVQERIAAPTTQSSQRQPQASQTTQVQRSQTGAQGGQTGARTLGPVQSTDTLWTIAAQVRPDNSVSMQQVMLAIQDLNPDAFIDENINRIKRGAVLRVPDSNQMRSRSQSQANQEVAAQNRILSTPTRTVDATEATDSAPEADEAPVGSGEGDQLSLMAADDTSSRDSSEGGSAGGDGDTAGGSDAGEAIAMEELDSARRENDELSGRVGDLQDQVATLQRLLELKNTQLADMQNEELQGDAEGAPASAPEEPADDLGESVAQPEDGESEAMSADGDAMSADDDAMAGDDEAMTGGQDEMSEDDGTMSADEDPMTADEDLMSDGNPDVELGTDMDMMDDSAGESGTEGPDVTEDTSAGLDEDGSTAMSPEMMEPAEDAMTDPDDLAANQNPEPESAVVPAQAEPAEPEKTFPDNIIDAITNNFIYQVALGIGLVLLLLLLLLLGRRKSNREEPVYNELDEDASDESDSFDLSFEEDEAPGAPDEDAIAEADAYIAYGRNDQAAQTLEAAISREPSRTDLRLKLLGVYADTQDRLSFEKQFGEIEALDDEAAIGEAESLRIKLEEAEAMPSIDDLESQLRSSGSESLDDASHMVEDELDVEDDSDDLIEYDLSGIELQGREAPESEFEETLDEATESLDSDDDVSIDFEASDLEETQGAGSDDLAADELELDMESEEGDPLDESFLDDLDAELEKVAGEEEVSDETDQGELDDLELDVSDEDLALMEEFSEPEEGEPSLDDELGLEDALSDEELDSLSDDLESSGSAEEDLSEAEADAGVPPIASDATSDPTTTDLDLDETDLGDDDDFGFLAGTDEAATKLDLARAYVEMGDVDGARDILEEVSLEGNDEQKAEAQDLLKNLS